MAIVIMVLRTLLHIHWCICVSKVIASSLLFVSNLCQAVDKVIDLVSLRSTWTITA